MTLFIIVTFFMYTVFQDDIVFIRYLHCHKQRANFHLKCLHKDKEFKSRLISEKGNLMK